jgi:hypothetical protein
MRKLVVLLAFSLPAFAQEVEVHKQILQRQQASDVFAQQLRQSQEALRVPASSPARQAVEARHQWERQRLDSVSAAQQRDASIDRPAELRPIERQQAADERRPHVTPVIPPGGIVEVTTASSPSRVEFPTAGGRSPEHRPR